ncbi:MAG: hypothetical protein BGO11_15150 [Solirubrobacterales bacterium 70-9]|nr:MAG: hypothetical protein BGO11_15150 [Solirubrobacterales bacterium 70-9]
MSNSCAAMTLTSEVFFSMPMNSLPVGGMIVRIACGRTTRRIVCQRLRPIEDAASSWPWSTELSPPRTISAM